MSATAVAGEAERTQAELVFQKAVEKAAHGAAEEACALFEESDRVDPQPGTEYELAKCYATVGRHASAWSRFRAVAEKLDAKGEHDKAAKIRKLVAETIEPKLARLTIIMPEAIAKTPGLDVKRDGVPVGKAMWGTATPVDPGAHRVRVVAPNKVPWEGAVNVDASANVTITVPALADEAPSAAPEPPKLATSAPSTPAQTAWPTQRKVAVAAGAIGVGALALGIGFGAAAISKANAWQKLVDQNCNNTARDCNSLEMVNTIRGIERDRLAFSATSTIGFVVGGVAVAGGIVIWLSTPRHELGPISIAPSLGPQNAGFVAQGSF